MYDYSDIANSDMVNICLKASM